MQPDRSLRHTKHVFRVGFLLLFVLVVLVLGRGAFVPDSWGEYGRYRGDSPQAHRDRPVRHGGDSSCSPCHEEKAEARNAGVHVGVRCELCHAPVSTHITEGEVTNEMAIAASFELCSRCHRELNARPTGFPQVKPRQHIEEYGGELGENACTECHDPHSPI